MNRIFSKILILLFFIFILWPNDVFAWQTGGQAGGGGSTGSGTNQLTDGGKTFDSGTYLFELVYHENGGGTHVLSCAVVYSGSHKGNIGNIASKARASASTNDCRYITSGSLASLAKRLHKGEHLDYIPIITSEDVARNYVSQFGLDINDLKEPGSTPGNYNSYGYRILIQKLTCFGVSGDWCRVLYPRKAFSNDYPNNLLFGGSYQNDLYTTVDDIGIAKSQYTSWHTTRGKCWNSGNLCDQLGRNFADYNRGEGYNIIGFNPNVFKKPYDYRPDSLCYNCDDAEEDWSYVYSDMANWEGIGDSLSSKNSTLSNYFRSGKIAGNDIACREQIRVKFPDSDNAIKVETGRYFTVGLPSQYSIGVPNFAPLTVERTKECHAYNSSGNDVTNSISSSQWNSFWNSDKFYKNAINAKNEKKVESTGKLEITYKEKGGSAKYNGTKQTDVYNTKINKNQGSLTVTNSYTLTADTYRYIRKDNGLSVSEVPTVAYTDVGVANFPISFDNVKSDDEAATVSFKYTIPKDSQLADSIGNPDYFDGDNSQTTEEDIYKVANQKGAIGHNYVTQGGLDANQFNDLKHTSCVLEYCDANGQNCKSGFTSCMNSKIKSGKTQKNCANDNYMCGIDFGKDDDNICRWDREEDKYYLNGEEISEDEYLKECPCSTSNGKYYINMEEVSKSEYEKVCPPEEKECPDDDPCCYGYCGPKKCPPTEDCDGDPGDFPGGINVIYRTIDLNNPFPGYSDEKRETGANWCSYDVSEKKLKCDGYKGGDNDVVEEAIFNNRDVKTNPEYAYNEEPIYEFELDSTKIQEIRDYNKKQEYSDFTLTCEENGTACKLSSKVKNLLELKGVCVNAKGNSFYTCDE